MKIDDLKFWVGPLTHSLFVGTVSKREPLLALQKRDITGPMINGVVEMMRKRELPGVEVTQEGRRYRLSLQDITGEQATSGPSDAPGVDLPLKQGLTDAQSNLREM